jgi:tetratricopeptide (TPR) repeat protein
MRFASAPRFPLLACLAIYFAMALPLCAQSSSSSSSNPDAAAQDLNNAVQHERVLTTDSNDANVKQQGAARKLRAGSAVGTTGTAIEPNEAVFIVAAGLNACGYDAGMGEASAMRLQVRQAMAQEVAASADARAAKEKLCGFVHAHDLGDPAKTLGQYLSLALMMQPTADLELTAPIPELPPDATQVAGVIPALKTFADAAHLHVLWVQHRAQYESAIDALRDPLTKEILQLGVYLRQTTSGNQDRRFLVIVEPMLAGGLVNARVYGLDYLMVLAPPQTASEQQRFLDDVKHFYLDFSIAPLIFGYPGAMERLQPLLRVVAEAPIEEIYRDNVEALISECMIRAIEAHTMDTGIVASKKIEGERISGEAGRAEVARQQQAEALRVARVQRDMQEGFIATRYFYEELALWEHTPGDTLHDAIGSMVYGMDVDLLRRQARNIQFVRARTAEDAATHGPGLRQREASLAKPTGVDADPLARASAALGAGNTADALTLAQQALNSKQGDPGQAMYVIAQAHALQGEMQQAEDGFAQALTLTKDPHTVAWSHIYLGRIDDIKQDRPAAVAQYKAALEAKSGLPDAIAAAQKGMQQPYAVPHHDAAPPSQ